MKCKFQTRAEYRSETIPLRRANARDESLEVGPTESSTLRMDGGGNLAFRFPAFALHPISACWTRHATVDGPGAAVFAAMQTNPT